MRLIFSAVVAVILLFTYVYLIVHGLAVANCLAQGAACTSGLEAKDFTPAMGLILATIAGLVSALVIAELSVTKSGEAPAARMLAPDLVKKAKRPLEIVTGLYLLVWLLAGFYAFFFGYLKMDPQHLPSPLVELGKGCLGIAVGAAYAFFGIDTSK